MRRPLHPNNTGPCRLSVILVLSMLFAVDAARASEFASEWSRTPDRVWIGSDYWANPMEDWRVKGGAIECTTRGPNRNVHLLTHRLGKRRGTFEMSVTIQKVEATRGAGSAGFRIGILSELGDYRSSLIHGRGGVKAGVTSTGALFIDKAPSQPTDGASFPADGLTLSLALQPADDAYSLRLNAADAKSGEALGSVESRVEANRLVGNIALVNNFALGGAPARDKQKRPANALGTQGLFRFSDWRVAGTKVVEYPDHAFGPILYAMHTLSNSKGRDGYVLKMTAQMPPIGEEDAQTVSLHVGGKDRPGLKKIGEAPIEPLSRTATFRIPNWDVGKDVSYVLAWEQRAKTGKLGRAEFTGTIRRAPVEGDVSVAGFTGNTDPAFPNATLARNVAIHDPDVLFFSGDQLYEGVGGYGIVRSGKGDNLPRSVNNYLRKIWLWGWAFRDLMRDRPTIALPDDHDVYQGNIWGEGGINSGGIAGHNAGGYAEHPQFVNAVHRTLCSHHPDLFDPTPIAQGITPLYCEMLYGRVSFAIIADRQFKSGPKGKVNTWKGRPDHMTDPDYDVAKLDKPGLKLLGDRQLEFLHAWAADWRGADAKCVLSQTIFCNLANYHGGGQQFIFADLDSNGWPQTGRNKAVDAMRRGFAFHYAGDQHLASIVQHGVDEFGDAGYSFCVPSIAAGYPRSWRPDKEGRPVRNRPAPGLANTGEYRDGFRNRMTVFAVGNPAKVNRKPVLELLHDKASGYGVVRFHKDRGEITMECWRLLFDANDPKPDDQFPGWPKTIAVADNYGRQAAEFLPMIQVTGMDDPVVQVIDDANEEIVYTIRVRGNRFRPKVFAKGSYTIRVGELGDGPEQKFQGVKSGSRDTLEAKF